VPTARFNSADTASSTRHVDAASAVEFDHQVTGTASVVEATDHQLKVVPPSTGDSGAHRLDAALPYVLVQVPGIKQLNGLVHAVRVLRACTGSWIPPG
jgi:hypothetical protein